MAVGKETPLMKQYNSIKSKYPNTLLLFRLGDFFETFNEDAETTARICGITLTKRNNGAAGDMPLAGFPYHQLDAYLPKLVRAGQRVAVCEQLEDPKFAKGVVKRGVVEVVTPGVALYDKLLNAKKNNFIASVYYAERKNMEGYAGISAADISTGEFYCSVVAIDKLKEVLESYAPAELVISKAQKDFAEKLIEQLSFSPAITKLDSWIFEIGFGSEALIRHFKTQSLKGYGLEGADEAIVAAGSVLHYISETQAANMKQILGIQYRNPDSFMILDYSTRRNLEITFSSNDGTADGSLFNTIDMTQTPQGGRLLKSWITRPLLDAEIINGRLEAVTALLKYPANTEKIRSALNETGDFERLISKVCSRRANPRDIIHLKNSLEQIPKIKEALIETNNPLLHQVANQMSDCSELTSMLNKALNEEAPASIGNGTVFKKGWNEELDMYLSAQKEGKNWIRDYVDKLRYETGIPSLKSGFNNVFGYYFEVTKVHSSKSPAYFERRQTLANAERYTTPELKELEAKILGAEESIQRLESELFGKLLDDIAHKAAEIQQIARQTAISDCLQCFAKVAVEYNYSKPLVDDSKTLDIKKGRHPVVERILPHGTTFVPNETFLDVETSRLHILTGPNMSGKSCYLRQIALIVLLAQVGSYVPAESAHIGIVDRIFTRVGAQDNLGAGESTFLVEMQESANILHNATIRSLILLDEVGRGTATFDGVSIAWAMAEYIATKIMARTLFATHYHEMNAMEERLEAVLNYKVDVIETNGKIIFTHKVSKGASDHSFGIYAAKMAGLPNSVLSRAQEILDDLERKNSGEVSDAKTNAKKISHSESRKKDDSQMAIFSFQDDELRDEIRKIKLDSMTPLEALQALAKLKSDFSI